MVEVSRVEVVVIEEVEGEVVLSERGRNTNAGREGGRDIEKLYNANVVLALHRCSENLLHPN